jgi:hypothetical protein
MVFALKHFQVAASPRFRSKPLLRNGAPALKDRLRGSSGPIIELGSASAG